MMGSVSTMISAKCLKNAIISGSNNICLKKSAIDDLNIFPVPDGDTGTNMSMTISAAANMLETFDTDDVATVAKKVASAMLRGARGNSGVILSLIFRGFSIGLQGKEEADGKDLTEALGKGVEAAYKAVMKPTEGTILTVARMAYEAGNELAATQNDPVIVWEAVVKAANDALALTPEMLPVLKKANVVDAGGKGLCTIFEGMLSVFKDGEIIEYIDAAANANDENEDYFRAAAAQFDDDIRYTYCTEFIVGRDPDIHTDTQELRSFLQTIGDCVVVVDDEEIIKVHVHTENPGNALQAGLEYGSLLTVKVENMKEQHKKAQEAEEQAKKKSEEERINEITVAEPVEEIGFVAVAAGEGLVELFKDCGCANVVSGGQSMNPSTEDIFKAVMATPAKKVVVLPNNKNIIMAAEQAVPLAEDRDVIVIPTKTIPQGISALLAYDPDCENAEEAIEIVSRSYSNVQTGLVTFAARDSDFGVGLHKIKENEIIALENGKLTITEKDIVKAAVKVTKKLVSKETSFITVISGEGVTEEQSNEVVEILTAKYGDNVDISYVNGGQPVYYFIISVE